MEERYFTPLLSIESVITCFEAVYPGPFYFNGEFHPFWEFVYVIDGELFAAAEENVYRLKKGSIIFHKPMEFHRLWSANGGDIHAYIVSFRASGKYTKRLEGLSVSLPQKNIDDITHLMDYVRVKFSGDNRKYHETMYSKWNDMRPEIQIFINLLENFILSLPTDANSGNEYAEQSHAPEIYRKIIGELNNNIYGKISLDELARKCCFSVSQLKRVFAQYSDIGIHKFYIKLKIAESIRLMGKGKSIGEISHALSFSNQNYFSAAFKRETGYYPTEYREKVLENLNYR